MNQNVKIAKQLIKLAKSLIGFDVTINNDGSLGDYELNNNINNSNNNSIANQEGKYENFTG
ncbi:MAG: hypothetical protein IKP65_07915 [Alphaproteobacteria bacterium]|nr:hypothetical protein [Alphaproteobacteria bacterium]